MEDEQQQQTEDQQEQQQTGVISFPDQATFMARLTRESAKTQKKFLSDLGFDSEDALRQALQTSTDSGSKLKEAQDALAAALTDKDQAVASANQILLQAEAKITANKLGVKPERLDYFLKLADLSGVQVTDGKADQEALATVFETVLTDFPEFRGSGTYKAGSDFSKGDKPQLLSKEAIAKMSPKEYESRRDEILAFMGHKK